MLNMGFLGFGQAGGKLVDAFLDLSDQYVGIAVNTAVNDLASLEFVPESHRYPLHGSSFGAGRTPDVAYEAVLQPDNGPEITELAQRVFKEMDYIWLVAGLGGGTGTGSIMAIAEYASQLFTQPVGLIITLPRDMDGLVQKSNALAAIAKIDQVIAEESIGAVVVLDNERFFLDFAEKKLTGDWRELANKRLAKNLHDLNMLTSEAGKDNFDRADFLRQLKTPGFMLLGYGQLHQSDQEYVFTTVKNTVEKGHLSAGYRLEETQYFTVIFKLTKEYQVLKSAQAEQYLSENLHKTFPKAADRFYGYYDVDTQSSVMTVLAGLGAPERVFEMGEEVAGATIEKNQKRVQFTAPVAISNLPSAKPAATDKPNPFTRLGSSSFVQAPKKNPFQRS